MVTRPQSADPYKIGYSRKGNLYSVWGVIKTCCLWGSN